MHMGEPSITRRPFGTLKDGRTVSIYKLTNRLGMEAEISDFGGIVVSLKTPDRDGVPEDIVLGYDTLDEYVGDTNYFGCIVGRYANRIAGGGFSMGSTRYSLARNDGENHLHGGLKGFNKVLWHATESSEPGCVSVSLSYVSPDGEEGYPGNLEVKVKYSLSDDGELMIDYKAEADKATHCNLSQHSYFNLKGAGNGDILDHFLTINSDSFTPIDGGLIPTGELRRVEGTPIDFTVPTLIEARINEQDEQLIFAGGYDHNWALNTDNSETPAVTLHEPGSGRILEVYTTEPGLQFYSGNFLSSETNGKRGKRYPRRGALCLETQHFPDSPNKPHFPSTLLEPGETYRQTTVYRFSVTG